jgi:hypothetical protein
MQKLVKTLQRASNAQLQTAYRTSLPKLTNARFGFSQVTKDFERSMKPADPTANFAPSELGRGQFASQLPDYAVSALDAASDFEAVGIKK